MSLSITGNFFGQIKNSKQYQAAAKDFLELHRQEVAVMSPEQKMMYELLGGEKAYMQNVMRNYNSDGDFTAGGIVSRNGRLYRSLYMATNYPCF